MKTVEEIKEELSEMREYLKDESGYLASETYGYILALEWVLEDNENANSEHL
jgi:hypothetical protein